MALSAWLLYASIAAAVFAAALLHYRRHEPPGRGRHALPALRGAALALLVLLVFDPALPGPRSAGAPTVALVDASLSMRLRAPDGTTRWEEARQVVAGLRPDRTLTFGAGESRPVSSPGDAAPDQPTSLLGPALRSALEAGGGKVVVVTDGALEDAPEVARLASVYPGLVEVRRVGEETAGNMGIVELDAPAWARVGEQAEVHVGVARVGAPVPDSVTVVLERDGRELARARLVTPPEGRISTATLRFTPRSGADGAEGVVRLDARLEEGDAEPADDVRSAYTVITDEPAGLVLVSFAPDQEPRFLLPVLERAAGLPATGWLAPAPGRFLRLGAGPEAGTAASEAEVRRAATGARLLVLHGVDESAPQWARAAAASARRLLLFPRSGLDALPFALDPAQPGDWYPDPDVPASPAAALIATAEPGRAPPLTALRGARPPDGWWAPLHALQGRRGEARPVLLAGVVGERRVAVALADGYWRWAFAEDHGRALYDAFWAGVTGWLLTGDDAAGQDAVRPEPRAAPRGEPIRWLVPRDADSLRITLHPLAAEGSGATATADTGAVPGAVTAAPLDTVVVASDGVAVQTPPRPGHYRYEARVISASGPGVRGVGELTVERYSPEFTRPARPLELTSAEAATSGRRAGDAAGGGGAAGAGDAAGRGPGRPLRSSPWPWAAVVALLCAEWALRRRWGLR